MGLFGEKRPCAHCGKKVGKPKLADEFLCPHCHQPGPWASETQVASWEAAERRRREIEATRAEARERFTTYLKQITGGGDIGALLPQAQAAAELATIAVPDQRQMEFDAFRDWVRLAIADDVITPEEHQQMLTVMSALSITADSLMAGDPPLSHAVLIAEVNSGYLPEVASPHLMAKAGEIVHTEVAATLMKEVAIREYQGGYQGFSFPIGKTGVRYKVGGSRGHSVQVGTKLDVADSGILAVTNKRAVYMGSRRTVDMPYSKLVNLTVYSDGVQFHLSNRVNAPLFSNP
jgi:hypothetical protein